MTIQPPTARVGCPARQTRLRDRRPRPLPEGWCYICWEGGHRRRSHHRAQPDTLTATAERIAARTQLDAEMPLVLAEWEPGHIELLRAVATELQLIATSAEALLARR